MINNPLIRPYFLGGVSGIEGLPLDSYGKTGCNLESSPPCRFP